MSGFTVMTLVLLDTEFTDLLDPQLLSLGLVSADGTAEHYVELDLSTDVGKARRKAASDFVRYGVLDLWGRLPGAQATEAEMGRRTAEWLLARAAEAGTRVEVGFDYSTDYELMEDVIREASLWEQVREFVRPVNVGVITGTIDGELAAERGLDAMRQRGLGQHHALADAHSLAAAYRMAKDSALRLARFVAGADHARLVGIVAGGKDARGRSTAVNWLRAWLSRTSEALGGCRPLDLLDEPDGVERVAEALWRVIAKVRRL